MYLCKVELLCKSVWLLGMGIYEKKDSYCPKEGDFQGICGEYIVVWTYVEKVVCHIPKSEKSWAVYVGKTYTAQSFF